MSCYALTLDTESFKKYYNLYNSKNDSIINHLRLSRLYDIESKYDIEQLLITSNKLSEENQLKEQEIRQLRLIMAGLGGLIILIIFSYVLFLKIRK